MLCSVHLNTCFLAAAAAKSLQSCSTLWDPRDSSSPGSPVPGVLQARTVEWVAISFSNAWKWKVKVKSLNLVRLLATPWKYSPPGSSVHGTCQARVLEWVAIALSTCFLREQHLFACVNYVMLSIISAPLIGIRYVLHLLTFWCLRSFGLATKKSA